MNDGGATQYYENPEHLRVRPGSGRRRSSSGSKPLVPGEDSPFRRVGTFAWKVGMSAERVQRIKRIVAHEQLAASAMLQPGSRGRVQRLRFWADQVGHLGWPDGMPTQ